MLRFAVHSSAQRRASPRSHRMPCGDIPRCIHVSVAGESAELAGEGRLALAVLRRDMPAQAAPLRGVSRADFLDPARGLVIQPPHKQAPSRRQDGTVKARLLTHVPTRLRGSASSRPDHVRNTQIFDTDQIEPAGHLGGSLLRPVFAPSDRAGIQSRDRNFGARAPVGAALGSGQPPPQSAEPCLLVLTQAGTLQQLTGRQRSGHGHAPVDADDLARFRPRNRLWKSSECNMPAPGPVHSDPVGLSCWDSSRPAESDPANFGNSYLADVARKAANVARLDRDDPESLVSASFPPHRSATGTDEVTRHSLSEITQPLLLNHLTAFGQPLGLSSGRGQLTALLSKSRRTGAARAPVRVLLDSQIPYISGVRAMLPQDDFLGWSRSQPVPRHKSNIRSPTDIPGDAASIARAARSPAGRWRKPGQADSSMRSAKAYLGGNRRIVCSGLSLAADHSLSSCAANPPRLRRRQRRSADRSSSTKGRHE